MDTLAGTGILHFLNIYVQQTPINAHHSVDNSLFLCQVSSVVHKRFLSKLPICRPLLHPDRDQLQNCLDSSLAELESWLKASKRTKLNHMSQAIKYIYINLNVSYGNETNLLLQ